MTLPPVIWERSFEIPTKPKAWARVGLKNGVSFEPKEQREHKATLIALAAPHAPPVPHDGPVSFALTFRLPIATSWPKWQQEAAETGLIVPTGVPDFDNLSKMIFDGLKRSGRWFTDDARVIGFHAPSFKLHHRAPGTLVDVRFYREPTAAEWKARKALGSGFAFTSGGAT